MNIHDLIGELRNPCSCTIPRQQSLILFSDDLLQYRIGWAILEALGMHFPVGCLVRVKVG